MGMPAGMSDKTKAMVAHSRLVEALSGCFWCCFDSFAGFPVRQIYMHFQAGIRGQRDFSAFCES